MDEYEIKTLLKDREKVIFKIQVFGKVTDEWTDGSFDFMPYDEAAGKLLIAACVREGIEIEVI